MKNTAIDYDNAYYDDNVYGHALALLKQFPSGPAENCYHLDVGCGFGRIAEPLTRALAVKYLGVDAEPSGLESLRSRGFEAQQVHLADEEATYQALTTAIGGRRLRSISFLDTLEHLTDGDAVLRAIGRVAHAHRAYVVVSTPNVAHSDIGRKLALGQWAYTADGLLDHTHVRLYTDAMFVRALQQGGLHVVESNDVLVQTSDQHFPATHPALSEGTVLAAFLAELRQRGDGFGNVNQFVRLCTSGPRVARTTYLSERNDPRRPFLSVLIRTQGTRLHTLVEALTCLAGQTDDDFEVVVIGHRLDTEHKLRVERVLEDNPEWLRAKTRLVRLDNGNRTRPLNVGFEACEGQYIAILDDDDAPFGHWVQTFRELHERSPGRILRAVAVRQDVRNVEIAGLAGLRAEGGIDVLYPAEFDLFDHMVCNQSPPVSLAFPRGLFHDLNHRFDETLTTTEDWDYLLRGAFVLGVATSPTITSIYRWWTGGASSRTVHSQQEWDANYATILRKTDLEPILLPPGSAAKVRALVQLKHGAPVVTAHTELLHKQLVAHLLSSSWKLTAPLRLLARLFGAKRIRFNYDERDAEVLRQQIRRIRRTVSWKLTRPLRVRRPRWWDVEP